MSGFDAAVASFLEDSFRDNPVWATAIGEHRYDGSWPDVSEAGRTARLAAIDRWHAVFAAMADLTPDDAIDRDLLLGELEAERFGETELREESWNPLAWVYLLGEGLFTLIAREFAPLDQRLESFAGRLEGIPAVIDGAKSALIGVAGRPVGRLQTETGLSQLPGVAEVIDDALALAAGAAADPAVAALTPQLTAAATTARGALADFEAHLREVVLPASEGDGRLGAELFAQKMRHTMRSETLTPDRILAAAEREFTAVRGEMVRLARDLWPTWCADRPGPHDEGALVRGVLDAIAAEHPEADDLLDWCRAETARVEAFCTTHDVIGMADDPLEIRWTPTFLRAFGWAMLSTPGPLDRGETSFFAITPIPEDWDEAMRESHLRENNTRMLRVLTIHEAIPGHYLQGAYANRCPSMVRSILSSGLFAEGWAVYVTQVMMDAGYGADDPALLLAHWKFYLRAVTNAIIDVRIHASGMTEDEAVTFMVDGGFQETSEATAKYRRARLSSTQLSTYFVGSMELWDIELEARRRAAADPSLQPPRDLPGGFGTTPGFRYRDHLETVIGHGAPSTALLRRALFG